MDRVANHHYIVNSNKLQFSYFKHTQDNENLLNTHRRLSSEIKLLLIYWARTLELFCYFYMNNKYVTNIILKQKKHKYIYNY